MIRTVAIIGLGTMGSAIQERLSPQFELVLIDIDRGSISDVSKADAIILAVKPQQLVELSTTLRQYIKDQIIISIMAGVTSKTIAGALSTKRVVRTMPNLALRTGQAVTAVFASPTDSKAVEPLLATWGAVVPLTQESQFDAFTALAGSGPAYFFQLAAALKTAATRAGFGSEQAELIAVQTFKGAASAIDQDPAAWVAKVASKGGTTEAALRVLAQQQFDQAILDAVTAATNRSRELS